MKEGADGTEDIVGWMRGMPSATPPEETWGVGDETKGNPSHQKQEFHALSINCHC